MHRSFSGTYIKGTNSGLEKVSLNRGYPGGHSGDSLAKKCLLRSGDPSKRVTTMVGISSFRIKDCLFEPKVIHYNFPLYPQGKAVYNTWRLFFLFLCFFTMLQCTILLFFKKQMHNQFRYKYYYFIVWPFAHS